MNEDCKITRCPQADDSAKRAVREVFALLGVDVDDPQQVEEFRKDLRFGQTMRRASDRGVMAIIALIFTGLAVAAWSGIQIKLGGH
jgi:hypothetical protein